MTQGDTYKAFISYSHQDAKEAAWLHRRLERYRVPELKRRQLETPLPKRLKPIFRDREELSAGSNLSEVIEQALTSSENLIVLCSPNAEQSHWVNQEILFFKRLGRADRIFTVIIDGEPFASARPGRETEECLPEAVRFQVGPDGELSSEPAEPLAADLRTEGDGRRIGVMKLISGLIGVGLDDLVQRDLRRARRRGATVLSVASTIVAAMGVLTWVAMDARNEAESRRADAEGLIEFMLGDLRDKLEPVGRLDVLDVVGDRASNYYDQFGDMDFDPATNGRRARMQHLIGDLRDSRGRYETSVEHFKRAFDITQRQYQTDPTNPDRVFEHVRSAFWLSVPERRAANYVAERNYLNLYNQLVDELEAVEGDTRRVRIERAKSHYNLARVHLRLKNIIKAQGLFESALAGIRSVEPDPQDPELRLLEAETLAWMSDGWRRAQDFERSYALRSEQTDILTDLYAAFPQDYRVLEGLIYAEVGLGNAARHINQLEQALAVHQSALERVDLALDREPGRDQMQRAKATLYQSIMLSAIEADKLDLCQAMEDKVEAAISERSGETPDNIYWDVLFPETHAHLLLHKAIRTYDLKAARDHLKSMESITYRAVTSDNFENVLARPQQRVAFYQVILNEDADAWERLKGLNADRVLLWVAGQFLPDAPIDLASFKTRLTPEDLNRLEVKAAIVRKPNLLAGADWE